MLKYQVIFFNCFILHNETTVETFSKNKTKNIFADTVLPISHTIKIFIKCSIRLPFVWKWTEKSMQSKVDSGTIEKATL